MPRHISIDTFIFMFKYTHIYMHIHTCNENMYTDTSLHSQTNKPQTHTISGDFTQMAHVLDLVARSPCSAPRQASSLDDSMQQRLDEAPLSTLSTAEVK